MTVHTRWLLIGLLSASACRGATEVAPTAATPAPGPTTAVPPSAPSDAPGPSVVARFEQAKIETAKTQCAQLLSALTLAIVQDGKCPADIDAMVARGLLPPPASRHLDPWERAFTIACAADPAGRDTAPRVRSAGPDGRPDTGDDVACSEP
ncbi:MAG: hypothetical protein K1X88_22175 [Nannocystaceae bacterium]|nr:hypothetical protein [Nannocystaceae bacterium]